MVASLQTLSLLQMFMESTFYGCFVLLFTVSSVVLNKRYNLLMVQSRRRGHIQKSDTDTGTEASVDPTRAEKKELEFWKTLGSIMIVLTTIHWAFAWATEMSDPNNTKFRSQMSFMRFLFEMLSIFVGDALLLSRLWIIGGKRVIVIVLPLMCFTGFIACALRLTDLEVKHLLLFRTNPPDIELWFLSTTALTSWYGFAVPLFSAMYSRKYSMNLYSAAYIAWRAQSANRLISRTTAGYMMHIVSIMVESAAIYAVWTFFLLVVGASDLLLWSIFLPISPAIYGCTMMLISVRLGLGWALGLGGQAAKEPKSLVMQFAMSEDSEMTQMSDTEPIRLSSYRD